MPTQRLDLKLHPDDVRRLDGVCNGAGRSVAIGKLALRMPENKALTLEPCRLRTGGKTEHVVLRLPEAAMLRIRRGAQALGVSATVVVEILIRKEARRMRS